MSSSTKKSKSDKLTEEIVGHNEELTKPQTMTVATASYAWVAPGSFDPNHKPKEEDVKCGWCGKSRAEIAKTEDPEAHIEAHAAADKEKDPKIIEQRLKQEENAAITDTVDTHKQHEATATKLEEKLPEEKPKEPEHQYAHTQLLEALFWIHDLFERANMTMVLAYHTAEDVIARRELDGDSVQIAARRLEWDSGAKRIIDSYAQYEHETPDRVQYRANNSVPVVIHILPDDYCIASPDTQQYHNEYFKLPNTQERFLEVYGERT